MIMRQWPPTISSDYFSATRIDGFPFIEIYFSSFYLKNQDQYKSRIIYSADRHLKYDAVQIRNFHIQLEMLKTSIKVISASN